MNYNISEYFVSCNINTQKSIVKNLGDVNTNKTNSIVYALNIYYFNIANNNHNVTAIIVTEKLFNSIENPNKNIVLEDFPKIAFWKFHNYLVDNGYMKIVFAHKVDKSAKIHPSAVIDGNVQIGKNVQIDACSIILSNSIIKENAHIHSGVIIGSDGMQVIKDENNQQTFIKHAGGVIIEENVNVLSGANISKAIDTSYTKVGKNSVIGIHACVAHNVTIGKNCRLGGTARVAGSTTIHDNVWIGPSATIRDDLIIHENASIKLGSVVVKNVKEAEEVSGNFAYNHQKRIRNYVKEQG
jgi:UDP-3-O-[3-hydroxymyristoyl] glucosamine N-acyltransferase